MIALVSQRQPQRVGGAIAGSGVPQQLDFAEGAQHAACSVMEQQLAASFAPGVDDSRSSVEA